MEPSGTESRFSINTFLCCKPWGLYFSKALFEGLIFGGAYVRSEICVSKSIGLACSGKEIYHVCFVLFCIRGQIPSTSPLWGLYSEGRFNGGFFAVRFWEAYTWRGLYMAGLIFGILRYHMIWALLYLQTQSTYRLRRKKESNKQFEVLWEFSCLVLCYFFFCVISDCSYRRTL